MTRTQYTINHVSDDLSYNLKLLHYATEFKATPYLDAFATLPQFRI